MDQGEAIAVSSSVATRLEPGDTVLGVELLEVAGSGVRGRVWRARDSAGDIVALKTYESGVHGGYSDASAFERGVDALNRLAFSDPEGRVRTPRLIAVALDRRAVVEEYVANGDARGIPALAWDADRVVGFFLALTRSVSALHELGMTHGALKPTNVLVDRDLLPVLSDPGKIAPQDPGKAIDPTDAIFRAPEELFEGATQSFGGDVFGLGKLLSFLLAGTALGRSADGLEELKALESCPRGLVRIVRRATAHDPEVRYPSVVDLAADVEQYGRSDNVGLSSISPELSEQTARLSNAILPVATAPRPDPVRTPPREQPERERSRPRNIDVWVGGAGVALAAAATLNLAARPLPSLDDATIFGVVLTVALALATFLVPPYRKNPLLGRVALVLGATLLYPFMEPQSLAVPRWQRTLRSGSLKERAEAACLLVRRGAFDLTGARLAGADSRGQESRRGRFREREPRGGEPRGGEPGRREPRGRGRSGGESDGRRPIRQQHRAGQGLRVRALQSGDRNARRLDLCERTARPAPGSDSKAVTRAGRSLSRCGRSSASDGPR